MNDQEKEERISYIKFRVKVVVLTTFFIVRLRKNYEKGETKKLHKKSNRLIYFDKEKVEEKEDSYFKLIDFIKIIWLCIMSFWLWFNMITSPWILLWPELSDENEHKGFWLFLWVNEIFWVLDILRKFFDQPKNRSRLTDQYEIAIAYIKSDLILDVLAILP